MAFNEAFRQARRGSGCASTAAIITLEGVAGDSRTRGHKMYTSMSAHRGAERSPVDGTSSFTGPKGLDHFKERRREIIALGVFAECQDQDGEKQMLHCITQIFADRAQVGMVAVWELHATAPISITNLELIVEGYVAHLASNFLQKFHRKIQKHEDEVLARCCRRVKMELGGKVAHRMRRGSASASGASCATA
ncbi:hypothetical protein DFH09DRAFT_1096637 [Mycena vulgaris]|nr:hypothetical protein DFH09DRAFT_1096637 [Mycena vulgaris]